MSLISLSLSLSYSVICMVMSLPLCYQVVTLTISIFLGGILVMHLKKNYCVPDPLGGPEPAAGCTEAE